MPHSRKGACSYPSAFGVLRNNVGGDRHRIPAQEVALWRRPYLAGEIKASHTDIAALGLMPLKLHEMGMWNPKEHYWGEPDEPLAYCLNGVFTYRNYRCREGAGGQLCIGSIHRR